MMDIIRYADILACTVETDWKPFESTVEDRNLKKNLSQTTETLILYETTYMRL